MSSSKPLLRRIAEEVLGPERAAKLWKRIEIIGDIAILRKSFDASIDELKVVAKRLLDELKYVRSVWATSSPVEGEYRTRDFVHLAGEPRTETIYREHGCSFKLDIRKVYFSPRLSHEHLRIAKLVSNGERLLNMYAGVGFFSIIAAKLRNINVAYSIDINPYAFRYMSENIVLNGVEDVVVPIHAEAYNFTLLYLRSSVDRVLMPLPELALNHLPAAVEAIDKRGYLHVYLHVDARKSKEAIDKASKRLLSRLRWFACSFHVEHARVVRTVGPCKYQVVVDVYITKCSA